jgi:hypothetical protein
MYTGELINDILITIRNVNLIILFVLCIFLYLKQNLTFKLFTGYVFVNLFVKWQSTFFDGNLTLTIAFYLVQYLLIAGIYNTLINHKKRVFNIFGKFLLVLFVGGLAAIYNQISIDRVTVIGVASNYLLIILASTLYTFQQLRKEKYYYYFNKGLLFFVLSTVILFAVVATIFIIEKRSENTIYTYITPIALFLDILMQLFFFKEWFYIKKHHSKSAIETK